MNSATTGLTTQQWFQAAQNAATVKPDDPRYPRAQAVIASARQAVLSRSAAAHLASGGVMPGAGTQQSIGQSFSGPQPEPTQTGAFGSFVEHFGHGASLGFSDELGGAITAIAGRQAGETTRQAYERGLREQRDYLNASASQHGAASAIGEIGGTLASSTLGTAGLLKALPGAGAAFTAAEGAPFAARLAASSALGATTGGVIGGISGAGNADEGSRLLGAGIGGMGGAVLGGTMAAGGTLLAKGLRLVRGGLSTVAAPVPDVGTTTGPEATLRSALAKMGKSPTEIEEAVARTKARFGQVGAGADVPRQPLPQGFIRNQGASEMGLGGRPSLESPPPAPIRPPAPEAAPTGVQSVGEPLNPGLALHDVAGNPIYGTELPGPRMPMPGSGGFTLRGPAAASAAADIRASANPALAVIKHAITLPLNDARAAQMAPILQSFGRQQARGLMAEIARADAMGSVPAPWRDFLLANLAKAGSAR